MLKFENYDKRKTIRSTVKKEFVTRRLADLIGMTQSNYSRRENGLKKISESEWDRIAKGLKVNKEDIYEEDNQNIIFKNIKGNSSVYNSGTIHYFNMPDFVLEHIELLKVDILI